MFECDEWLFVFDIVQCDVVDFEVYLMIVFDVGCDQVVYDFVLVVDGDCVFIGQFGQVDVVMLVVEQQFDVVMFEFFVMYLVVEVGFVQCVDCVLFEYVGVDVVFVVFV